MILDPLLFIPGLRSKRVYRALLQSDSSWNLWLEHYQKILLTLDKKQGFISQSIQKNDPPFIVERLIKAGCLVEKTIKQPNPWTLLFEQIQQHARFSNQSYLSAPQGISHLYGLTVNLIFDYLQILSSLHADTQGLNLTSQALLFHIQRQNKYSEKDFQRLKLIRSFASLLQTQIESLGFLKANELCPSLFNTLNACLSECNTPGFKIHFEIYGYDYQIFSSICQTFSIYQNQYQLQQSIPKIEDSTSTSFKQTKHRL